MKIGLLPFDRVHQQAKNTGSSRIRGYWLTKHWPEAEIFVYGQKYDAIIFQQTYISPYLDVYDGVKILDLCDPDWMTEPAFAECLNKMDGVVTSTEPLAEYVRTMTSIPVICIDDHHDFEWYGKPKEQIEEKANTVAWFGYSHNIRAIRHWLPYLKQLGLKLFYYTDKQVLGDNDGMFGLYDPATINENLKQHDFVLAPKDFTSAKNVYKSNNREVSSWCLGLPCAVKKEDIIRFMDGKERMKEMELRKKELVDKWDIKYYVSEYKEFMEKLHATR